MKTKAGFAFVLGLCLLGAMAFAIDFQKSNDRFGYKDTIVVERGETRENVVAFGGDIIVEGRVRKNVVAFGGTITVSGEVGDSVVGIGSRITLKSTAVVEGDLFGLGGVIEKEPGFRVNGDTVYFKSSELMSKVFKEGLKSILSLSLLPVIIIFKFVSIFIWFLLALLVASLFPKQVTFASGEIRRSFWPVFGTGLLAYICFVVLIIFAAILCLVLIGIPILFALALAALAIKIFGKVVLFYFFGESLAKSLHWRSVSPLGGALLGLLVVTLIGFIPILGFLFSLVLGILGWGVVVRTKFGTTENAFRRTPKPAQPAAV
jgi:hypothetical protein